MNDDQPITAPLLPDGPVRAEVGPIALYFRTLKNLYTRPTEFFQTLRLPVNPAFALVFALVTHWIGSALEYLWTLGFARSIDAQSGEWRQIFRKLVDQVDSTDRVQALGEIQAQAMHWILGAGSVMIDPFKTAAKILFQTVVLWAAARIFVPRAGLAAEQSLSFRTSLAIVCFATGASLLSAIPMIGGILSIVFTAILMIIGASELYRVTRGRAALIVFFPQLVILALVLFLIAALSVAALKLVFNFIGT